nr:MAG TPA: hypothetical protein [Caudoviricetes sp.]
MKTTRCSVFKRKNRVFKTILVFKTRFCALLNDFILFKEKG